MTHPEFQIPGYQVHGPIGQGGMASIYLATQESLNRKVAIKVLRNGNQAQLNERFINEAHFIASLSNPHVITIHDISTLASGDHYIAMEFLEGGDLSENRERFREPGAILRLIRQIATGLGVVHAKGIIHRDVKPANILFRKDGTAVLTDFGIAKDVENDSDLTLVGHSLGSPSYSSPEQAQGQPLDITTDIYGLGVILLELLLGHNPFKGSTHTSTAINHIQQALPPLPEEYVYLQPLLDRMLAKRPQDRFQTCEELATAIELLLDPTATAARPSVMSAGQTGITGRLPRFLLPAVGAVAALLLVFFATYESETEREINRLLEQAELRLEEGRFIAPEQDNARYYYRQVLLLEQDNDEAHEGLERVTELLVQDYVTRGAEALERGNLVKPADTNALHFYREALALEEDNPQALAGIDQLAAEYSRRARAHLLEGELDRAHRDANTGLSIQPENAELLALRTEIEEQMPTAKKLIRNVFGKIRKTIDGSN
ncbi:protein kinase [Microbulbifer sp. CAU 1566]|uniref:serine/threonine-protein kinase n=1 Tax=Microbulbifer sp. CAU 1566 TaxID=2933269 RepID=UPI002003ADD4|nr:serine/threonine-protein kinase [Microbulbifer sp. CAU 1566]MCK7596450.1 protein kinase [Microbulbifer sp. CAU 1566]